MESSYLEILKAPPPIKSLAMFIEIIGAMRLKKEQK
jgi:hypothetical protein